MPLLSLRPVDVVLARHGETTWSLSGQHTGATDLPLTPAGEAAARALGPVLGSLSFARVWASPLERARRTGELAGYGPRLVLDPDLMEWNYGAYEGRTSAEIGAETPGWLVFRDGCPEGESPDAVGARVDRVIARLRQGPGPTLLFSHGHLLRVLAARWLGLPPLAGQNFLLDTTTISVLSDYRGTPALGCWNAPLA
ncbi:MAG: histidine phosphatase family protein [Cyanobacteria bacterium K_Offshore_surface_m2_239]|nr:histidine phosphatase family protein [Cyanobacteria bacterium K_Offshore_surface_m2_239]